MPETFLARLNGTSRQASAIFRAKKVVGTSKSRDFVQGTILDPWNGPIKWFWRVYFQTSSHIYSTRTLVFLCHLFSTLFWHLFWFFVIKTPPPYICILVVLYGLINVPGLFRMCRDCLECAGTVWKCAGTVWNLESKQSRHNRDLWKSTLFCKVHYVGYSDIKILC